MAKKLAGKTALVTGASRGIGRAIGIALGVEGATIVLTARSAEKLEAVAEEVRKAGGRAEIIIAELTEEDSIKNLAGAIGDKYESLDILVNNAGVTLSAGIEETTTEAWEEVMQVNARAPFILCREALSLLRKAQAGCIINIGSVVAVKGYPLQSAYTASKHALRGMTISLAEELRGSSVRVHLLCPGGADTDMVGLVRPDIKREELIGPEEIAELVLYLTTH
ncbi:MAG: SDR family NAD(P)-dependent oxidoreductase, partial [Planctomycetota bacterium]